MKGEKMLAKVKEAAAWLEKKTEGFTPEVLMITGSGLSNSVPALLQKKVIPYGEIPGFALTTVSGHKGELWFGKTSNGTKMAVMCGRFHFYEGHDISFISYPIRLLNYFGAKKLIVTAAVGSLKKKMVPGDIVILRDQINLMMSNPLIGNYHSDFGEMFVDMSHPYDCAAISLAAKICSKLKIKSHKAVYLAVSGPAYETAAEVKMYAKLGGDVAGMSVVPEIITAKQLKMKTFGLAWISNFATGISNKPFDHNLVLKMGQETGCKIRKIIEKLLEDGRF